MEKLRIKAWLLALTVASGLALAADGEFPGTIELRGEALVLNGTGMRKKAFVKVYEGGLYLSEPSSDAGAIIDADAPMTVHLKFIYDGVAPEQLTDAWDEGFEASTGGDSSAIAAHIAAFNALFDEEAREGDSYSIAYTPGIGIVVAFNGIDKGTVDGGLAFKKAVFGIWLGDKPADKGLKAGMLGID